MIDLPRAQRLVDTLCNDDCAGRRAGTPGGARARGAVMEALRGAGLDPRELDAPRCGGANVVAAIPGEVDRWVVVGAHYDHLGTSPGGAVYRGADDNAAAVAALTELAHGLAVARPRGRGVLLVAFDGEEPPFYATGAMGSQQFVRAPPVPLDRIDLMISLELLGCPIGPEGLPDEVRQTLFALGAERSEGTATRVDALAGAVEGVTVRRADAEVIPPLSDHLAFWEAGVPFMLLTGMRSKNYHTPRDTAETLDWQRIGAATRWLEAFVRDQCARPEDPVRFLKDGRDDRSTLDAMRAILTPLAPMLPLAAGALRRVDALAAQLDAGGRLDAPSRAAAHALVAQIERAFG